MRNTITAPTIAFAILAAIAIASCSKPSSQSDSTKDHATGAVASTSALPASPDASPDASDAPEVGTNQAVPGGLVNPSTMSAASGNMCVVSDAHEPKCWGVGFMDAYRGTGFNAPKHVLGITSGVEAVCAGGWYEDWRRAYWDQVCVLTAAGAVKCSRNQASGIGKPPDAGVVAISCGMTHACAIMATGGVECWGGNYSGELGDGTNNWKKGALRPVLGLEPGVTAISAGSNHTCAITAGGGLKCWGGNDSGQLGDGTSVQYKANPVTSVSGLESGVVSVSAGHGYTCAIASGGSVKCWGLNDKAQLGDGTKAVKKVPTQVVGLESGVVAISAGSRHACALSAAGGVWCWGTMMGGGTTVQKSTPAKIPGLESGVVGIAAGEEITCAITTGKRVMCWGYYYKAGGPYGKDAAYWNITPREQSGVL